MTREADGRRNVVSTLVRSVVAVSNEALRPELLDTMLLGSSAYDTIVVESIEGAYSRIKTVQPEVVVVFMNVDDIDACQLLTMLQTDRGLRGINVVSRTTAPDTGAIHDSRVFDERCDTRQLLAS